MAEETVRVALPLGSWLVVEETADPSTSLPPDFLLMLMALTNFMRLSLRGAAHAALSSAAWQEIRVRFGRDDNITSVTPLFPAVELNLIAYQQRRRHCDSTPAQRLE